ncbi:MAG: hypothetical protein HY052_03125 [Proteobacteria bacterium]|nr:hypothetical protein [Pseudomonadota bacterium]
MFFSKKKMRKMAAQNVVEFTKQVEQLDRELTAVENIPDAGERYLALTEVENKIKFCTSAAETTISTQTKNGKTPDVLIGSGFSAMFGGLVGAMIFGPLLLPVFLAGPVIAFSAAAAGESMPKQKKKILQEGVKNYLDSLTSLSEKISTQKKAIVSNQLIDLSQSKRFGEICDRFPDVGSAFAKRAAQDGMLDIPRVVKLDKKGPKP